MTKYAPHPSNLLVQAEDMESLFTFHPPQGDQPQRYTMIRAAAKKLAQVIMECCPPSADRSAAVRKVREAVMTANAAIALEPREEE